MTKTQCYTATSIDGFVADADNSLECRCFRDASAPTDWRCSAWNMTNDSSS